MNPRERSLLIALLAVLGTGTLLYAGNRWWLAPLQEYSRTIKTLTEENDEKDFQVATFNQERKKLALARLKSLPTKPEQAAAEYMAFLEFVLKDSSLNVEVVNKTAVTKVKVVTPIPNVKDVGHQIVSFTVRATGELRDLVKMMEQMQKAPYEHRIQNLVVTRVELGTKKDASDKLTIQMVIETLLVARSDHKNGLPAGFDPKLLAPATPANRDYADMAKKNIFVGEVPPPPPPPKVVAKKEEEPEPKGPFRPPEYTPAYVYITQMIPETQTAYMRNRIYGGPERKLNAKQPGYQEFQIADEFGDYIFFRAKVLKVEQRQLYFQVGLSNDAEFPRNSVWTVQIGQSFAEARDCSFNKARIDLIDDDLFDEEFEKSEAAKDKKTKKDNKKDNKGKTTGKLGGSMK
jgi:hypothetical protein